MAVDYLGKKCYNLLMVVNLNTAVIYHEILTLENVGIVLNYSSAFMTLAIGVNFISFSVSDTLEK